MKKLISAFLILILATACSSQQEENVIVPTDSTQVDSAKVMLPVGSCISMSNDTTK